MDAGILYQLFSATVRPEDNVRIPAEQELKNAEISTGFLPAVLQILGSADAEPAVRQGAAVYFKNRCQRGWDPSKANPVEDQDKAFVRQHILQAVVHLPHKLRVQLITCLGSILQIDLRAGQWPSFLTDVMQLVQSSDEGSVHAGVAAVYEYVKVFRWGEEEKRKPMNVVVDQGLPILHTVALRLIASDAEEAGFLLKIILKIYAATIRLSLSDTQQASASLVPWGTLFVSIVEKPLDASTPGMPEDPADRERHPWWKAKKWAYSNLHTLFERYARNPEKKYANFHVMFMEHFAPNILRAYLKQVELIVAGAWMSGRVKQHIADYLRACIKPKITWSIIKPHLDAIVLHFIFPLVCISQQEQELWEEDPLEFVRRTIDNAMEDFRSPSHAAKVLLYDLAKLRSKQTFQPIMTIINDIVTKYNSTPAEQQNPQLKDGAMEMMSVLAHLALADQSPIKQHMEQFLVTNVIPELKSPHAFLRSRACSTILGFSDLEYTNDQNAQYAFQGILHCLKDAELPVRVAAALALPIFLDNVSITEALKPHIQDVIGTMMALTNEVDMEALTNVLERLVDGFSDELKPFAVQLATQLCESFIRITTELIQETDDNEYSDQIEDKTAAAQGVAKTMFTLVLSMEASNEILAQLEVTIVPAIVFVLDNLFLDLYEEVFDLIETLTFCQKNISPVAWQLWPFIYKAFKEDGYDYIDVMSNTLENYIAYGSSTFAQSPTHLQQAFDILHTILGDPTDARISNMNRSRATGIVEAMLLYLRGHLDALIPQFIDMALPYLAKPNLKVAFRVRCLEVIINAIYYNPAGTLALLEQRNALVGFLQMWFKNLGDFKRVHDKKLCVVALSAVLELPLAQLPPTLQGPGWGQILQALLTVFDTYPAALAAREAEEDRIQNEDDDDVESDDDDEDDELFNDTTDDVDVFDSDDKYMQKLAMQAASSNPDSAATTTNNISGQFFAEDEEDDSDDDWEVDDLEEDTFFETPLDEVEAYEHFEHSVRKLLERPDSSALMQQCLSVEQQARVQEVWSVGAEYRAKVHAKKVAEALAVKE
ncbi:hypothetical protein HDU86_001484 [Geranomyces michiganensis]|nr:hypothetical protein HDU86_001484 [Geranomyces michiganensis]